jgi:ABC-type sugar transport system ATPase subunit
VGEAASLVNLTDLLERKPGTLSGGQRQRVALARAIVRRPAVFLMDEPLSNLDAPMRAGARALLTELHARLGITVIYVTHDQVEALTMGSRLAVMSEGRLQQVGTPEDVYATPANTLVARFIGSPGMNLLAGRVAADGTGIEAGGALLRLATRLEDAGDVIVGVRPEHLCVAEAGLCVDIRAIESHGHERIVRATTVDGEDVRFRVEAEEPSLSPGDAVRLSVAPARLHVFDATTGSRIVGRQR